MSNAAQWAKRRSGGSDSGSEAPKVKPAPDPSGSESSSSSVGSASSESFDDDKFHLPADHQPFLLLPGWDAPPPPPPPPPDAGGSSSGSGSESGDDEGGSESEESGSGDSGSKSKLPVVPALPPPAGFACAHCAMFKAIGNGNFGCESQDYQRWAGTDKLVETKSGRPVMNPERASSDWYSPANGPSAQPIPTRHTPK